MNLRNTLIIGLILLLSKSISGFAQCVTEVNSFAPGEKITFQAYYNWGFIWIHAGDIQFSVNQKAFGSQQVYQLEAIGNSVKSYDWMYKVRDRYISLVDMNHFQPLLFEQNTNEGGYIDKQTYTYSYPDQTIHTEIETSKQPKTKDSVKMVPCTFDVLSGVYYCRTLNFDQYKKNDKIPLNLIIDGKIYRLYIRYLGKENIRTHDGAHEYRCIKFSVLLVAGTIFKGGENMNIWVTDDANRIPVLVEAKILIGSVKAYLNTTQGLRNASDAMIK